MTEKNFSERYIKDLITIGNKLFSNIKYNSKVEVVLSEVDKSNYTKKYIFLLFRNLIKFWDEEEIEIPNDVISKLTKFKKPKENNIDTYVPSDEDIRGLRELSLEIGGLFNISIKILLESGIRITELELFYKKFDKNKVEITDNIVTYPLFHIRGKKIIILHLYY